MKRIEKTELNPTHVCAACGEWFEVENAGRDTWLVSPCDNESDLAADVWTEAAGYPICPYDSAALKGFMIRL